MIIVFLFLVGLGILLILNVPIVFALMLTSWIFFKFTHIPIALIGQKLIVGISSTPLLAIPFFMLSAQIMTSTSLMERLVNVINSTIGFIRSGLAIVNVVASMIFAGMSGSATADTAGLSGMIMNAMIKEGYDKPFSVSVTAASSTIGIIIPPSIPLVIYSFVSNASTGALFLAGVIPGIMIGISQIFLCIYKGKVRNYPKHPRMPFRQITKDIYTSIPVLILPLIILGGIFSGVFTPTEASIIAVFYALILGLYFKELSIKKLKKCLIDTAVNTGISLFIIGVTTPFGWLLAFNHVTKLIADWFLSFNTNPTIFLLLIVFFMIPLGCVMDIIPIILITTPIFLPIAIKLGINPILYGTILNVSLAIGLITPPVGSCLWVACAISHTTISEVISEFVPFIVVMTVVLILLVFFPQLSLYLPLKFMPLSVH
jgi:tripartite ATP-independent transporter DctM subunit